MHNTHNYRKWCLLWGVGGTPNMQLLFALTHDQVLSVSFIAGYKMSMSSLTHAHVLKYLNCLFQNGSKKAKAGIGQPGSIKKAEAGWAESCVEGHQHSNR